MKNPRKRFAGTLAAAIVAGACTNVAAQTVIDEWGSAKPLQKYPAGKGANWVEIVGFD
jgi:hypothetical protein